MLSIANPAPSFCAPGHADGIMSLMERLYKAGWPPTAVWSHDTGHAATAEYFEARFTVSGQALPAHRLNQFVLSSLGLHGREIAGLTATPLETVKSNVVAVYRRLGARSMPQAIVQAFETGLYTRETPLVPERLRLHPREQAILAYAKQGYDMRGTAQALGISPLTVKSHRQHMLERHRLSGHGIETIVLLSELLP